MTSSCLQKQMKPYVVLLVESPKSQGIIIGPLLFFFFFKVQLTLTFLRREPRGKIKSAQYPDGNSYFAKKAILCQISTNEFKTDFCYSFKILLAKPGT